MALTLVEGTLTAGSAVLRWNAVPGATQYRVYRNGRPYRLVTGQTLRLRDLVHERAYEFELTALMGETEQPCGSLTVCSKVAPREFDVCQYGAVGDGVADDTAAMQAAIDDCTPQGVVYLPGGRYRLTAPLRLKTEMSLYLDRKAVLCGDLTAPEGCDELMIAGRGTLEGNLMLRCARCACLRDLTCTGTVALHDCRKTTLDTVTLQALRLTGACHLLAVGCTLPQGEYLGLEVLA